MRPAFPGSFRAIIIVFFCGLTSCAKLQYLLEQGVGQLRMQNRARANSEVLSDPRVPKDYKRKIKLIGDCKSFFFSLLGEKDMTKVRTPSTYEKTFLLDRPAVTYLVMASPYDRIEAKLECFILMGCFPYLGFFSEGAALEHMKELDRDGLVTSKRPVYAYSSLGYFDDPILSSFFLFDDMDLAEIIFHELFHTIFFIKDEVELNENLANHFGKEMAFAYFRLDPAKRSSWEEKYRRQDLVNDRLMELVQELQRDYEGKRPAGREEAQNMLTHFLKERFFPQVRKLCQDIGLSQEDCFPLHREWNNASFAGYLTYEKRRDEIEKLQKSLNLDLNGFLGYLRGKYREYREGNTGERESFSDFLLGLKSSP